MFFEYISNIYAWFVRVIHTVKWQTVLFLTIQFNMSTKLNDSKYCYVSLIIQLNICPVSWGRRINLLHLCRRVRPLSNESPRCDTKQSDCEVPVMLEFGECGVPLLCHLSKVQFWHDRVLSMCCIVTIHIQLYTYTCGNKINNNDERTHFFRKIYLSLYSKWLRKGWESVMCERWVADRTATYWPPVPLSLAALLSRSAGLLNQGSWEPIALC